MHSPPAPPALPLELLTIEERRSRRSLSHLCDPGARTEPHEAPGFAVHWPAGVDGSQRIRPQPFVLKHRTTRDSSTCAPGGSRLDHSLRSVLGDQDLATVCSPVTATVTVGENPRTERS